MTSKPNDIPPKDVLIIDNHSLYRTALADLLQSSVPGIDRIRVAERAAEVISTATACSRIVLVLVNPDTLSLDRQAAVDVVGRLFGPRTNVILIEHSVSSNDCELLPSGAAGTLCGTTNGDDIAALVSRHLANKSGRMKAPGDTAASWEDTSTTPANDLAGYHRMTRRQRQVMGMISKGLANKEIAARLGIAEGTVKAHVHTLFKTIGATNRTQVALAYSGVAAPDLGLPSDLEVPPTAPFVTEPDAHPVALEAI